MGNRNKLMKCNAKQHYKMYKAGKNLLYASISMIAFGSFMFLGNEAHADTTVSTQATTTPESDATSDSQQVTLKSSSAADTSSTSSASSLPDGTTTTENEDGSTTYDLPVGADMAAAQSAVSESGVTKATITAKDATTTESSDSTETSDETSTNADSSSAGTSKTIDQLDNQYIDDQGNVSSTKPAATTGGTENNTTGNMSEDVTGDLSNTYTTSSGSKYYTSDNGNFSGQGGANKSSTDKQVVVANPGETYGDFGKVYVDENGKQWVKLVSNVQNAATSYSFKNQIDTTSSFEIQGELDMSSMTAGGGIGIILQPVNPQVAGVGEGSDASADIGIYGQKDTTFIGFDGYVDSSKNDTSTGALTIRQTNGNGDGFVNLTLDASKSGASDNKVTASATSPTGPSIQTSYTTSVDTLFDLKWTPTGTDADGKSTGSLTMTLYSASDTSMQTPLYYLTVTNISLDTAESIALFGAFGGGGATNLAQGRITSYSLQKVSQKVTVNYVNIDTGETIGNTTTINASVGNTLDVDEVTSGTSASYGAPVIAGYTFVGAAGTDASGHYQKDTLDVVNAKMSATSDSSGSLTYNTINVYYKATSSDSQRVIDSYTLPDGTVIASVNQAATSATAAGTVHDNDPIKDDNGNEITLAASLSAVPIRQVDGYLSVYSTDNGKTWTQGVEIPASSSGDTNTYTIKYVPKAQKLVDTSMIQGGTPTIQLATDSTAPTVVLSRDDVLIQQNGSEITAAYADLAAGDYEISLTDTGKADVAAAYGVSIDDLDFSQIQATLTVGVANEPQTDTDGSTTVVMDSTGQHVIIVDRTWGDGDVSHIEIDTTTHIATLTETPNGESQQGPASPDATSGTVTLGKTTLTYNGENDDFTLSHVASGTDIDNAKTVTVKPDGSTSYLNKESYNDGLKAGQADYATDPMTEKTDDELEEAGQDDDYINGYHEGFDTLAGEYDGRTLGESGATDFDAADIESKTEIYQNAYKAAFSTAQTEYKDGRAQAGNGEVIDVSGKSVAYQNGYRKGLSDFISQETTPVSNESDVLTARKTIQDILNSSDSSTDEIQTGITNYLTVVSNAKTERQDALDNANSVIGTITDEIKENADVASALDELNEVMTNAALDDGSALTANINDAAQKLQSTILRTTASQMIDDAAQTVTDQITKDVTLTAEAQAEQTTAVTTAVTKAKAAIDDAATADEINSAVADGQTGIDDSHIGGSEVSEQQGTAKQTLEDTADAVKKAIAADPTLDSDTKTSQTTKVDDALSAAESAVAAAKTADDINTAVSNGTGAINTAHVAGSEISEQQSTAKAAIDGELSKITTAINADATLTSTEKATQVDNAKAAAITATTAINAATTADAINTFFNKFEYNMGYIIGENDGLENKTQNSTDETLDYQTGYTVGNQDGKIAYQSAKNQGSVDGTSDGLAGKDSVDLTDQTKGYQDGYTEAYQIAKTSYDKDYQTGQAAGISDGGANAVAADMTGRTQGYQDGYNNGYTAAQASYVNTVTRTDSDGNVFTIETNADGDLIKMMVLDHATNTIAIINADGTQSVVQVTTRAAIPGKSVTEQQFTFTTDADGNLIVSWQNGSKSYVAGTSDLGAFGYARVTVTDDVDGTTAVTTDIDDNVTNINKNWDDGIVTNVQVTASSFVERLEALINEYLAKSGVKTTSTKQQVNLTEGTTNTQLSDGVLMDYVDSSYALHKSTEQNTIVHTSVTANKGNVTDSKDVSYQTDDNATVVTTDASGKLTQVSTKWDDGSSTTATTNEDNSGYTITQKTSDGTTTSRTIKHGESAVSGSYVFSATDSGAIVAVQQGTTLTLALGSDADGNYDYSKLMTTTNVNGDTTNVLTNGGGTVTAVSQNWQDGSQTNIKVVADDDNSVTGQAITQTLQNAGLVAKTATMVDLQENSSQVVAGVKVSQSNGQISLTNTANNGDTETSANVVQTTGAVNYYNTQKQVINVAGTSHTQTTVTDTTGKVISLEVTDPSGSTVTGVVQPNGEIVVTKTDTTGHAISTSTVAANAQGSIEFGNGLTVSINNVLNDPLMKIVGTGNDDVATNKTDTSSKSVATDIVQGQEKQTSTIISGSVTSAGQENNSEEQAPQAKLPQTDNQQEIAASLLGSSMLLTLAGMLGLKKKKRQK